MTNQEAIEDIEKNILPVVGGKSLLMAISALQAQESPKPTAESVQNVKDDDLVSRKVAIGAMSESLKRVFPEHRQIAEKCLKALPSAQSEVIKCENCKYRGEKPIADGRYWCDIHDTYMYYCSDAERRTDDLQ